MRRSLIRVLWPLVPLSLLAFGATALADDPEGLTLAVSSTRESCTLGSVTTLNYSIEGGVPPYRVTVDGREVAPGTDTGLIRCHDSTIGTPFESTTAAGTRYIAVNVRDSTGTHVYEVVEVRLVPPLPAPTQVKVTSRVRGTSAANLLAEWWVPYLPREQRTEDFAIRWRLVGTSDWRVEHHRGKQRNVTSFRETWRIDAPPGGERREVQIAQLRHVLDLQAPEALVWSKSALVTTAAAPRHLQAEATHDAITLRWGPHEDGLVYRAELRADWKSGPVYVQHLRLDTGPFFEAHFPDLLPDTLYRVEVYLDDGRTWGYALRQHRFELRTEAAPVGWTPQSWAATNISARLVSEEEGRRLEVTWTPPSTGARHETGVCARPPEDMWSYSCETVSPGGSRVRLPLRWNVRGGTFLISITTKTSPAGVAERELHVPFYEADLPTTGDPAPAPRFAELRWSFHHENPRPGTWRFEWDRQGAELTEVSWQQDGRTIIRETDRSGISFELARGDSPKAVRVRLLRAEGWSPWSAEADIPSVIVPLQIVRLQVRLAHLEIDWAAPANDAEVIGYRIHLSREGGDEELIDVGRQNSAKIAIEPAAQSYRVEVAALTEEHGELGRSYHHWYNRESELQPLRLVLSAEDSGCPPAERAPLTVQWSISGGEPPFTLSLGDSLGFETEERQGSTVVDCLTGTDGLLQDIRASVVDANRQTADDLLDHRQVWRHWFEEGQDPFAVKLGPRNAYRDRVLLSWDACRWRYMAALRWRRAGTEPWTYVLDFPFDYHGDGWRCSGTMRGLTPLTTYEYQLARYIDAEQLRRPEQLQWTATETVTTLGDPQALSIERDEGTVSVSWQRQPDAWAYLVGLRAEGRSWWKRHEPSGEAIELVSFYGVPQESALRVELLSPPLKDGEEEIPVGLDSRWSPGH